MTLPERMLIEDYRFGEILIGGKRYTNDVIILPDRVFSPWWRKQGHYVCIDDLKETKNYKIEKMIFGTGAAGCVEVDKNVIENLKKQGVDVIIKSTTEATKVYNECVSKKEKVIACLHLTC